MNTLDNTMLSVYLVDDDSDDQEIFKSALSEIETPVSLKVFNCGPDLLADLNNEAQKPDAIFLDLYMPQMDGEACLAKIRANLRFENIPIIIYSTEFDIDRIEELFSLGANRYLRKANSYDSLVQGMDKTIASIKRNKVGGTTIINIIV